MPRVEVDRRIDVVHHVPDAPENIQAALSGAPTDAGASDAGELDDRTSGAKAPDVGAPDSKAPDPAKPGARTPDARTTALIALLQAAGLFGKLFPAADRIWASELAKDYWPSRAVEDELRMIRLAEEEAATF